MREVPSGSPAASSDALWRRTGYALIAAICAWQAYLAFGGTLIESLRWTIDDGFYYLKVADSIAAGQGSTFDGRHLTNGYHPLWLALLVPVMYVTRGDPVAGYRAVQLLQLAILVLTLVVVYRIARRRVSPPAALVPLLVFAWPRVLTQTNTLLESGLYLLLLAIFVERTDELGEWVRTNRRGALAAAGALLGVAILCRLDAMFVLPAIACTALVARERPPRWGAWIAIAAPAAAVLIAYMAWNKATYGHALPISGRLKTTFPLPDPNWQYLRRYADFIALSIAGAIPWFIALARTRRFRGQDLVGLAALFNFAQILLFMRWGVENWYFCLAIVSGSLAIAAAADRVASRVAPRVRMSPRALIAAAVLLGCGAAAAALAHSWRRHQHLIQDHYYYAAKWAEKSTPPDAVFAMTDAGIFRWFSGRTTVNTDGLMNDFEFLEVLRRGEFGEYLRAERIDYLVSYWNRTPEVLDGGYGERRIRALLRPYDLDGGGLIVKEQDEVYRDVYEGRLPPLRRLERNAVLIWRLRWDR